MDVYGIPHGCESAEVAALLARLTPKQRRVLRQYVWEVELGQAAVTAWLRGEKCLVRENSWYRRGDKAHYLNSPVFRQALDAYRVAGIRWQNGEEQRALQAATRRLRTATPMAADKLVALLEADNERVQLDAAEGILDRAGFETATKSSAQATELSDLSDDDLERIARGEHLGGSNGAAAQAPGAG